ncbi:MAG: hypothetical protein QOC81_1854 [Thermoanaerobaculia bacterium]|jgi:hypothetical protein|nr:hypothetical protein [Thermoanaerobaculia bacterium]
MGTMKTIGTAALLLALSLPVFAETKCHMKFTLSGWSAFYKTASGTGTITCDNGQSARVNLSSKGGGITFGRSTIKDGLGTFTDVEGISELYGTYVQSEAHAGAGKSTKASAMTKGEVSLSLVGKGKGVDVGIAFGKFTIEKAGK